MHVNECAATDGRSARGTPAQRKSLDELVLALVAEHLGADATQVAPASRLVGDLGCDSLDLLQVAIAIEREMNVELPDAELERITTVQQLIDCVRKHLPVTGVVA